MPCVPHARHCEEEGVLCRPIVVETLDGDSADEATTNVPRAAEEPRHRYPLRSHDFLAANVTAAEQKGLEVDPDVIPHLVVKPIARCTRGLARANELLQLQSWAWERLAKTDGLFVGAVIDKETGKSLEYRQLMKIEKYNSILY